MQILVAASRSFFDAAHIENLDHDTLLEHAQRGLQKDTLVGLCEALRELVSKLALSLLAKQARALMGSEHRSTEWGVIEIFGNDPSRLWCK